MCHAYTASPINLSRPKLKIWSMIKKNTAAKAVIITTITEPVSVSLEVGHVTLLPSLRTS